MMIAAPGMPLVSRRQVIAAGTIGGLILGALGPFGSYLNGSILTRSAYWIGAIWLGLVLYGSGVAVVRKLPIPRWQHFGLLTLVILVASIPETASTRAAAFVIWPRLGHYDPGWWLWYVQAATIGAVTVSTATLILDARTRLAPPPCPMVPEQDVQSLQTDRPARLPTGVIALQMEDHYVRAHTRAGSTLIQMPLSHAIMQLSKAEGLRTHRSWWVAWQAVERIDGTPRAMRIRLHNGLSVPVARSAVALLREAGWLERQAAQDRQ